MMDVSAKESEDEAMVHWVRAACLCNKGLIRHNNEDNFLFNDTILEEINQGLNAPLTMTGVTLRPKVFAVFDGMGGEACGEAAAFAAAWHARKICTEQPCVQQSQAFWEQVCQQVNLAVFRKAQELQVSRMGATLAMLCFSGAWVSCCNLGDSKIFRFRDGNLTQLSVDHTDERQLKQRGIDRKPKLIQHLGIDPKETRMEPWVRIDRVQRKDAFLICSDGLTDMLSKEEIVCLLTAHTRPKDCVSALGAAALEHGGRDNITVILCSID